MKSSARAATISHRLARRLVTEMGGKPTFAEAMVNGEPRRKQDTAYYTWKPHDADAYRRY